jgi:hypothetical protein
MCSDHNSDTRTSVISVIHALFSLNDITSTSEFSVSLSASASPP